MGPLVHHDQKRMLPCRDDDDGGERERRMEKQTTDEGGAKNDPPVESDKTALFQERRVRVFLNQFAQTGVLFPSGDEVMIGRAFFPERKSHF